MIHDDTDDNTETKERAPDDPDNPASVVQCDHFDCERESDGRLCDACIVLMRPETPDVCPVCNTSIRE